MTPKKIAKCWGIRLTLLRQKAVTREDARDSTGEPEGILIQLETALEGQGGMLDRSQSFPINKLEESQIGMEYQQSNLSADPPVLLDI